MIQFDYVLLLVVLLIAIVIMVEFIKSKNGKLRKLMIAYFAIEIWGCSCLVLYLFFGFYFTNFPYLLPFILVPKFFIKLSIYKYLRNR